MLVLSKHISVDVPLAAVAHHTSVRPGVLWVLAVVSSDMSAVISGARVHRIVLVSGDLVRVNCVDATKPLVAVGTLKSIFIRARPSDGRGTPFHGENTAEAYAKQRLSMRMGRSIRRGVPSM